MVTTSCCLLILLYIGDWGWEKRIGSLLMIVMASWLKQVSLHLPYCIIVAWRMWRGRLVICCCYRKLNSEYLYVLVKLNIFEYLH